MSKVLYQAKPKGNGEEIKSYLESHLVTTQLSFDKRSSLSFLRYEPPQIFVMEVPKVESNVSYFIDEVRAANFDRPIVLLGGKITTQRNKLNCDSKLIHFMDLPLNKDLLLSLLRKLLMNPSCTPQRHPRFVTELELDIEAMQTGEVYTSKMVNLSKGGAFCEFQENPKFQAGELIKLNIPSDGNISERTLNGKVVWIQKKSLMNPTPGLGVRFVGVDELYQSLLS
ncbi:MAG: PilZ domain-containing protein [Bdellovibrionales bacterium]|nr:PilZ domain-containing protein [Bdellovibrionales bacterium]